LRGSHAEHQLGALGGFVRRIAGDGAGEAALRADSEPALSMKRAASLIVSGAGFFQLIGQRR
jgi:hypothetical protein